MVVVAVAVVDLMQQQRQGYEEWKVSLVAPMFDFGLVGLG